MCNKPEKLGDALRSVGIDYQTIVDNIGVGISVVSPNMELLYLNPFLQKQFPNIDVTRKPLCYKAYKDPPQNNLCAYCPTRKTLQDGKIHNSISHTPRGDNTENYEIISAPLKDSRGNVIAAIEAITKVTGQMKLINAFKTSEARLRLLLENIPDIIAQIDRQGRIMYINRTVYPGNTPEGVRGNYFYKYVPREYLDTYKAKLDYVFQTGQRVEWVAQNTLGIYYSVRAVPVKTGSYVDSVVLILNDITEQLKLDRQNRLFRNLSDRANLAVVVLNNHRKIIYVNEYMAHLHGYEPQELIGKPFIIFHDESHAERIEELSKIVRTQGWFQNQELLHTHRSGYTFPMLISAIMYQPEGEDEPVIAVAGFDLTEHKKMETELAFYREKVRNIEQIYQLSAFRSAIVHEISQPLSVVRLMVQDSLEEIKHKGNINTIRNNLRETLKQVNNAVNIIHKYRKGLTVDLGMTEDINFAEIITKIKKTIESMPSRARLHISVQDMANLPVVRMDPSDMEQICFILMQNAQQAASSERLHNLNISSVCNDGTLELIFHDDCGGIHPKNINRIFEPFYTTKQPGEGTGLGLFIVRQILNKYGGQICVESNHGYGTTFRVSLPVYGIG